MFTGMVERVLEDRIRIQVSGGRCKRLCLALEERSEGVVAAYTSVELRCAWRGQELGFIGEAVLWGRSGRMIGLSVYRSVGKVDNDDSGMV